MGIELCDIFKGVIIFSMYRFLKIITTEQGTRSCFSNDPIDSLERCLILRI